MTIDFDYDCYSSLKSHSSAGRVDGDEASERQGVAADGFREGVFIQAFMHLFKYRCEFMYIDCGDTSIQMYAKAPDWSCLLV